MLVPNFEKRCVNYSYNTGDLVRINIPSNLFHRLVSLSTEKTPVSFLRTMNRISLKDTHPHIGIKEHSQTPRKATLNSYIGKLRQGNPPPPSKTALSGLFDEKIRSTKFSAKPSHRFYQQVSLQYMYCLYRSIVSMTTVGTGVHIGAPQTTMTIGFVIFTYLCGVLIFATIVGNAGDMIVNMRRFREKYLRKVRRAQSLPH